MLLTFMCVCAVIFSAFVNTAIKSWFYDNLVIPELQQMEMDGAAPEESNSLFFTTVGMVLLNNMIPFTLGALIGLYAVL